MHKIPVFQPYLEEEKYGGKAGFFMAENEDKLEKYGQPEKLKQTSHIRILTIIGKWRDMRIWETTVKQRNMSM